MSLSQRLHAQDKKTAAAMRLELQGAIRTGQSILVSAERLLETDRPVVRLPKYVQDLRAAARHAAATGDVRAFRAMEREAQRDIRRLGQGGRRREPGNFTVRSAGQQLAKDLHGATLQRVDKVVDRWVMDRAQYQARVVARHETVEAYRDLYRQGADAKPYTVGYRWQLTGAGNHIPDVCDLYANQDLFGLGPGGYPPEHLPDTPHPHCVCAQVAIIDTRYFKRVAARERGAPEPPKPWLSGKRENAQAWLERQPESVQRELLGPTRLRLMQEGRQVLDKRGAPIPVHELLGRAAPRRTPGPAVNVAPLVKRDRAALGARYRPAS